MPEPTPSPAPAEPTPSPAPNPAPAEPEKADEVFGMLDKVVAQREEKFARQTLELNGIDPDDAKTLVSDWIANRKQQSTQSSEQLDALKSENEALKASAHKALLDSELKAAMTTEGVPVERLDYVNKLIDLSKATKQDGSIDGEQVKAALTQVLKDLPALKGEAAGVSKVGAGGAEGQGGSQDDVLDSLLEAAGVKKKKE